MGTTRITHRTASILGMTLALFTLLLFIDTFPASQVPWSDPHLPLEFTDVRIVRLDLPVPPSDIADLQRVTIHTDFSVNSPWCQWHNPMALPCPNPLLEKDRESPWKHMRTQKGIPLL